MLRKNQREVSSRCSRFRYTIYFKVKTIVNMYIINSLFTKIHVDFSLLVFIILNLRSHTIKKIVIFTLVSFFSILKPKHFILSEQPFSDRIQPSIVNPLFTHSFSVQKSFQNFSRLGDNHSTLLLRLGPVHNPQRPTTVPIRSPPLIRKINGAILLTPSSDLLANRSRPANSSRRTHRK